MQIPTGQDIRRYWARFRRSVGVSVSETAVVGVSVRPLASGKYFAHLLSDPLNRQGWVTPVEPVRFFARRTVIPKEFHGREIEFIRYNRPELIPLPESHSIILRFSRTPDSGETLFHGIRENRLEEFLDASRQRAETRLPTVTGVVPPAIALTAAIQALRPNLPGKTIAILIGGRTTRYLALKDGRLINIFDDTLRPDTKNAPLRFRKTLQRVLWHMEKEGLGGPPDQILLMGDSTGSGWKEEIQKVVDARVEFFDLPREVGLALPAGVPVDMAVLALGAAFAHLDCALAEFNFLGLPKSVTARRFDAYDLVIYGSLAVMVALSFITLNSLIAGRIQALNDSLRANSRRILEVREDVESKRGIVPVAENLLKTARQRTSEPEITRQIIDSLPEFLVIIAESIPEGVKLDRVGTASAADPTGGADPASRTYQSILSKRRDAGQLAIIGQTRAPEKVIRWVESLAGKLDTPVTLEEMNAEGSSGLYRFRITISTKEEKDRA